MNFDDKLRDYAELIAVHGLNVQPGQIVNLSGEVPHRDLLLLIGEQCYSRGARCVDIEISDGRIGRQRIDNSEEEHLTYVPDYTREKYDYLVESQAANLKIVGPEFPTVMKGADPKRTNTVRKALYEARKKFYEDGIDKSLVHWTVAAGSTPGWGKRIYPDLGESEADAALWEDIFLFCRVGAGNHLEQWKPMIMSCESVPRA